MHIIENRRLKIIQKQVLNVVLIKFTKVFSNRDFDQLRAELEVIVNRGNQPIASKLVLWISD